MCGRFVQAQSPRAYASHFGAEVAGEDSPSPSWNVAPTRKVGVVLERDGRRLFAPLRWGLIPGYAKDPSIGSRLINARAETLAEKPTFKGALRTRRCMVPADGFYEWERRETGGKLPHYVHSADGTPLALAGLWGRWRAPDGELIDSFTIVTTRPNAVLAPIHDRMPAILPPENWEAWLDPGFDDVEALTAMLAPATEGSLTEHPVSTLVNRVENDFPQCVAPLE